MIAAVVTLRGSGTESDPEPGSRNGDSLHTDLAKAQKSANDASAAARRKSEQAARSGSDSSRRMAQSAAEREAKKAADAQKKIAGIADRIASNNKAIASKQASREQQEEFLDLLGAMAAEEANPSRRAFLEVFPDGFGLAEDVG